MLKWKINEQIQNKKLFAYVNLGRDGSLLSRSNNLGTWVSIGNYIPFTYEPQHDKTNKMTCAIENSDQPGRPPSLIRLRCPHEETLGPQLPTERTVKTDQTGRMRLRLAHSHFVGGSFYHDRT